MSKSLASVLALSLGLLPGCVLAVGNGPDDEGGPNRVQKLEHRVAVLEQKLQECSAACCAEDAEDADDDEAAEVEAHEHGKAPAATPSNPH